MGSDLLARSVRSRFPDSSLLTHTHSLTLSLSLSLPTSLSLSLSFSLFLFLSHSLTTTNQLSDTSQCYQPTFNITLYHFTPSRPSPSFYMTVAIHVQGTRWSEDFTCSNLIHTFYWIFTDLAQDKNLTVCTILHE